MSDDEGQERGSDGGTVPRADGEGGDTAGGQEILGAAPDPGRKYPAGEQRIAEVGASADAGNDDKTAEESGARVPQGKEVGPPKIEDTKPAYAVPAIKWTCPWCTAVCGSDDIRACQIIGGGDKILRRCPQPHCNKGIVIQQKPEPRVVPVGALPGMPGGQPVNRQQRRQLAAAKRAGLVGPDGQPL